MSAVWSLPKVKETSDSDGATICGAEGAIKTTLFKTPRMPGETAKPDKPNSPAPTSTTEPTPSSEKPTDAGAGSTTPRSPRIRGIRELLPEEYEQDFVIGGAVPPKRR